MDQYITPLQSDCSSYAFSEEYISLLLRYNSDLTSVRELIKPDCLTIINNQFLIAYRSLQSLEGDPIDSYRNSFFPKCYTLTDTSAISATGALRVRSLSGLDLSGKGVLLGFIDTGIDYTNPLFQTKQGQTRIEAIWDQSIQSSDNRVQGYGTEYTADIINEALTSTSPFSVVPSKDENGHGTFLASVCGGSDQPDTPFTSMAPNANFVIVKLKQAKKNLRSFYGIPNDVPCYSEDDIMLGIHYLLLKASALGRPIAICIGLGTNQGDHNASTMLEQYLSVVSTLRGVCIVCSGGNELGYNNHFRKQIPLQTDFLATPAPSFTTTVEIDVGEQANTATNFSIELWGNSPDLPRLSIISPSGERRTDLPYLRPAQTTLRFLFEQTSVYVEVSPTNIATGSPFFFLRFENAAEGIWTLEVSHKQTIDLWLPVHDFLTTPVTFVVSDPDITLTSPGNGIGPITVAGYNHTNNSLYRNSSHGYTRLQRIKPDITAPSVDVYGAFTTATSTSQLFTRRTGTSIGAALVAGAAALLLEWGYTKGNNTNINTTFIREYLIRGAVMPQNRITPNREFGFGLLDLYNTFNQLRFDT